MRRVYSYAGPNGGTVIYPSTEAHYVDDLGEPCAGPPDTGSESLLDQSVNDDYRRQNESLDEAADSLATIAVCLLILFAFAVGGVILWLLS